MVEEGKRWEEVISLELKSKSKNCLRLENEVVNLRNELKQLKIGFDKQIKFEKKFRFVDKNVG